MALVPPVAIAPDERRRKLMERGICSCFAQFPGDKKWRTCHVVNAMKPVELSGQLHAISVKLAMNWFLIAVLLVSLVTGCSSPRPGAPKSAAPPSGAALLNEQIAKEAVEDAAMAIRTGKLYVCDAGTIATYTPGISTAQAAFVRNLPHRQLPSGCTEPKALRSVT